MSVLWESEKHLLRSDELRTFLCNAVASAMETWRGSSLPKPRSIMTDVLCDFGYPHTYVQMSGLTFLYCSVCGKRYCPTPQSVNDGHPVSPYAGGNIG